MISGIVLAVYLILAIAFFCATEDSTAVQAFRKAIHRAALFIFFVVFLAVISYDVWRYYEIVPQVNITLGEL